MSNQYIIYNFHAEIQGCGSRSEVTTTLVISLTRSLAVATARGRAMLCHWKFCWHSTSLIKFMRSYTVEYGVCKNPVSNLFRCNKMSCL